MKVLYAWSAAIMIMAAVAACNASGTEPKNGDLAAKQAELARLKSDEIKLGENIKKLEDDIAKLDSTTAVKPKLVSITTLSPQDFTHAIDLQGKIDADNIVYVTPRGPGGQVKAVYVKEGDFVPKGKLLLKLDDAVTRQQIEQANIQLSLAKTIYQRRKNLWDQNIGTEVELLQAKSNVDNLQKSVDLLKEQLDMSNVYAEISGVAEMVTIKVGEFFSPASATGAGILLVNTSSLKVVVDIPENYLDKVKKGAQVIVEIPDQHLTYKTTISLISQTVSSSSRGFIAEAKIPSASKLKPNQLALVKIQDYSVKNVIVIPVTTMQTDDKGKYVFVVATEKGKQVARKHAVVPGEVYGESVEIKSGLQAGDQLVTEGYQGAYDGQPLIIQQ